MSHIVKDTEKQLRSCIEAAFQAAVAAGTLPQGELPVLRHRGAGRPHTR